MRKADLIGGIGLFAVSLFLIFVAIPLETEEGTYYGLSPKVYPTVMASGMALCALGLVIQAFLHRHQDDEPFPMTLWQFAMFLVASAIVLGTILLIGKFGIWAGGPALIAGLMVFLGERNLLVIGATCFLPVGLLHVLATYVLKAPLP